MGEIAGYILAGGKSRRMGGENKALLMLEGRTFLDRIKEALSLFPAVYLSADRKARYPDIGLTVIEDMYPDAGPLGGICTGLTVCSESALFVTACDMPFLDRETVLKLLDAYKRTGNTVIAKTRNRVHPLLGVYPGKVLPVMQDMLEKGEYRMMELLQKIDHTEVQISGHSHAAVNVNSRRDYAGLTERVLNVEEAVSILKSCVIPVEETENVILEEAQGRILAENAAADRDQPPFARSAMDGYALRSEDTAEAGEDSPVCLEVTGEICAGRVYQGEIRQGQAVRIMTGAPIPDGADAVIRQENTDYGEERVKIFERLEPSVNCCPAGEDYRAGEVLLKKGARLSGIDIGVLAGLGMDKVCVRALPRVGIISTGDELCPPGVPLEPGKIYDSNRYLIGARMKELGIAPGFSVHCGDDAEAVAEQIRKNAREAQTIITTGGVSVGKKDIMHAVIQILGAEKLFWKVALKPGAPTLAAVYDRTLLICLSGNPFGAAVNFELLVRPVLGKLAGDPRWEMKKRQAIFHGDFRKRSAGRRFLRAYYEAGEVWIPEQKHASGILSTFAGCNCLIDIEAGNQGLREGDKVWVHLM